MVGGQPDQSDDSITLRNNKGEQASANSQGRVPAKRPLVIDLGTYTTKAGFAPEDISEPSGCFPQVMVPTLIGQTKLIPGKLSDQSPVSEKNWVGFEALRRS